MKKIFLITTLLLIISTYSNAKQNCKDLPGFKTVGKDSVQYLNCLRKTKLNTDSTLTDIVTGEKKLKIPNPMNGLKNLGKALKPSILEK
jgi:hypothetical protein